MIGTIFSIFIAGFVWLHLHSQEISANINGIGFLMIAVAIPFLFVIPLGTVFAWGPLQRAEQNSTPRLLDMFRKDGHIRLATIWLIIFPLATFALAIDIISIHILSSTLVFAIWLVALGVSIDASYHFILRVMSYLNPLDVVKMFTQRAKECVQNEREIDLCDWIDAISEVALKAIQRHSMSITQLALSEEQQIARLFLEASKSISHHEQDKQTKEFGITDKVSYTMFFLYQRLDSVFESALKNKLETTCSYLFTILGKIAIDAAKYDVSMASPPLRFLGKFAKKAQDEGFEEATLTASCVLLEVAKVLVNEIDISYFDIKDPFLSIINGLELITKDAFRRDKTTDISLLKQPFQDLKVLFESEKVKQHQDTPVIVQNIDRVLGEFEALQMVMNTLPKIPDIPDTSG